LSGRSGAQPVAAGDHPDESEVFPKQENAVHKLALLTFATESGLFTSRDVADTFEIPLNEAAGYLCKAHGRGYLRRFKVGRKYLYVLSAAGARHLAYWLDRANEAAEAEAHAARARNLVTVWCSACRNAIQVPRTEVRMVVCRCGRDYVELDE